MIDVSEIVPALEAVLFAAGEPLSLQDLQRIFERYWADVPAVERGDLLARVPDGLEQLKARWQESGGCGFALVPIAGGWTFRSLPKYKEALRAMREDRPGRLTRAALETLAIVAYRQPVTKPELDQLRGVDSGGTLHLLLERQLIRIIGKKQEPGRPLLYGTSQHFLSFFNLKGLSDLPTLREFNELTEESQQEVNAFDGLTDVEGLKDTASKLALPTEPETNDLDTALLGLKEKHRTTREALAGHGVALEEEGEGGALESAATVDEATSEAAAEAVADDTDA